MISQLAQDVLCKTTEQYSAPLDALKHKISTDADCLSLCILLKQIIEARKIDPSSNKHVENLHSVNFKDDHKNLFTQMRKMLAEETVVQAFPRAHSCIGYFVTYLANHGETKLIKSLWKITFEGYCFNENQLYAEDINKRVKLSLNNSGFFCFQYLLQSSVTPQTILSLFTSNFMRMWLNRLNMKSKNRIDSVLCLEERFKAWVDSNSDYFNQNSALRLELVKKLFGPNSQRRFTLKHSLPIFTKLAEDLPEEQIRE
mmetsp:Transcript_26077/g.30095  ORF Transcript_26077/g.30095 Transcript_26077/m.30095 type:complete len:257 (-) Transcript_26077:1180-1950(-)